MTTETSVTTTGPQVLDVGARDVTEHRPPPMFSAKPTNLSEAMEFAKLICNSSFIPQAFRGKPGDVLVVMMQAAELGIGYFQALQFTCVIHGRPTIYGDLVIALVRRSGLLEDLDRSWDEATQTATARVKRRGFPVKIQTFSMADAVRAGLAGGDNYKKYPQRMCAWRALSWALRDEFADVLLGITIAEEAVDYAGQPADTPIAQPRPTAQLVSEFLAPPPSEKKAKPTAGAAPAGSPTPEMEVVWITGAAVAKTGKGNQGEWKLYKVSFEDGRNVATFSSTHYETAKLCLESGAAAYVTTGPGRKPSDIMLLSIDPVMDEEGAAVEVEDGQE